MKRASLKILFCLKEKTNLRMVDGVIFGSPCSGAVDAVHDEGEPETSIIVGALPRVAAHCYPCKLEAVAHEAEQKRLLCAWREEKTEDCFHC